MGEMLRAAASASLAKRSSSPYSMRLSRLSHDQKPCARTQHHRDDDAARAAGEQLAQAHPARLSLARWRGAGRRARARHALGEVDDLVEDVLRAGGLLACLEQPRHHVAHEVAELAGAERRRVVQVEDAPKVAQRRLGGRHRGGRPEGLQRDDEVEVALVVEPPLVGVHHLEEPVAEGGRERVLLLVEAAQLVGREHAVVVGVELQELPVDAHRGGQREPVGLLGRARERRVAPRRAAAPEAWGGLRPGHTTRELHPGHVGLRLGCMGLQHVARQHAPSRGGAGRAGAAACACSARRRRGRRSGPAAGAAARRGAARRRRVAARGSRGQPRPAGRSAACRAPAAIAVQGCSHRHRACRCAAACRAQWACGGWAHGGHAVGTRRATPRHRARGPRRGRGRRGRRRGRSVPSAGALSWRRAAPRARAASPRSGGGSTSGARRGPLAPVPRAPPPHRPPARRPAHRAPPVVASAAAAPRSPAAAPPTAARCARRARPRGSRAARPRPAAGSAAPPRRARARAPRALPRPLPPLPPLPPRQPPPPLVATRRHQRRATHARAAPRRRARSHPRRRPRGRTARRSPAACAARRRAVPAAPERRHLRGRAARCAAAASPARARIAAGRPSCALAPQRERSAARPAPRSPRQTAPDGARTQRRRAL
eukprot:scaffold96667_cov63-Phaeocystis_antarctica.AAC.1